VLEGGDGELRVILRPGFYLRTPLLASLSLYPVSPLRIEGRVDLASREGAAIEARYAFEVRILDGALEELHRARAGIPLGRHLRERVEELLRAHAASRPLPDLTGPAGGAQARRALAAALEAGGLLPEGGLRIGLSLPDTPESRAERAALRQRVRPTGLKVLLVGLDGADWDLIDPLLERGRLPHLGRLKREGAWGKVRSDAPMLSPLLWTTVATGRSPERHGVMDFLMRDPDSGRMVPISSSFRRVKALWNVLSDFGVASDFVAWWATWPAEKIEGTIVSDRLSYSLFPFLDGEISAAEGTTYPEEYLDEIRERLVSDRDISYREVRRFVDVSEAEFRRLRAWVESEPRAAYTDPVNHLTRILAATRNYHAIALDLLRRGQKPLTAVYYQGIDEVNHRFAHFAPPRLDHIHPEEFRRYSGALEHFYEYQDELVGELLERLDPDTVVVVLSDHGFANGPHRPRDFTPSIEGRPARWHTLHGVRILRGPQVRPGPLEGEGRLVDVAPTLLRLLGVPRAKDLEGRVWEEAFDPRFLKRAGPEPVDTYESVGRPLSAQAPSGAGAGSREFVEALRSLGYIGEAEAAAVLDPVAPGGSPAAAVGPPQAPAGATAAYHANLATILLRKGDVEGAEREFRAALAKEPRFGPAFGGLAEIQQRRGRHEEALGLAWQGIDQSPDPDDGMFAAVTRLYLKLKREPEGAERMARAVRRLPRRAAPRICHGILLLRSGRGAEAEEVLLQALEVDPAALPALQELFELYEEQGRLPDLERALAAALQRNPRSVPLRNWLAWVRSARGDPQGAERFFRDALREDPDNLETLSNLGSLLTDLGRADEAVQALERALRVEPRHWQSRVNLIVALGKASRLGEARRVYEEGEEAERERTEMLNALAYACYLNGDAEGARAHVRRSLTIDPEQPEAQRLLDTVEGG
jgi:predicted AlkP superfamily phosphohydrolase/phosphomutase/tetratricopeptide (TPR) repeat protein